MKKNKKLPLAIFVSVILFAIFSFLQSNNSTLLKLPTHWLAISITPIIIALITDGYITKFNGFGVELEASLKSPISYLNLLASDALSDVPECTKGNSDALDEMKESKRQSIQMLRFISGESKYNTYAIQQHLEKLPNLKRFIILNTDNSFICFLPITLFNHNTNIEIEHTNSNRLVNALKNANVLSIFSDSAITLKTQHNNELINVLKKMREYNTDFAAVISPTNKYLGIVLSNDIERRIADSVLSANR